VYLLFYFNHKLVFCKYKHSSSYLYFLNLFDSSSTYNRRFINMFVKLLVCKSVCIILLINNLLCDSTPASPHIHTHHHEREEDGAYSPRDKSHITHGQHHSEFDHEAILGV